jgi:hypothetical protein
MRLHVVLPNESVEVGPERILGLAQRAEELALEGVWPPDTCSLRSTTARSTAGSPSRW